MLVSEAAAGVTAEHLPQIDVIRLVPMLGVVAVHTLIFTQPAASVASNAALMLLHANREVFFFVTAFLLGRSTRGVVGQWRRRYPLVVLPYLAWTVIYWFQSENGVPWPPGPALRLLGVDLGLGWFHLYFLLVTMQLYALFPLLAWMVRRTRGHHWKLLGVSVAVQVAFTVAFEYGGAVVPGPIQTWFAYAQVEATSYQLAFVAGALAAEHLPECLAWLRRHARAALAVAAAAALAAEGWYAANLALGESAQRAADVFQPAELLVIGAAVVGLVLLADRVVRASAPRGRLRSGLGVASRASFGVYLAHMLPMQLLLLTPLASLTALSTMPRPLAAVAVYALVLSATFALVLALQRTPLSLVLTGRPRLTRRPVIHLDLSETRSPGAPAVQHPKLPRNV
jgi:surface polysaccharide O-acyltransferase-like enzyme